MKHVNLSVVLATYNEEKNLPACLESVRQLAGEIVIVDGGSLDQTLKIASQYHCRVISTTNKPNFHINKNMAIDAATGDWILQLDADEVVSKELADEIRNIISIPGQVHFGFWVNRRNWFLDRFLKKGGQYPDPTLRLYRRGYGRLPAKDVHEQAEVRGSVGWLKNDLLHYRDTSFEKYLDGFNRYSTFIAGQLSQSKQQFNIINTLKFLFVKPIWLFCKIFIRHRGYIDGKAGFIFAIFSSLVPAVAYIKFWQHTYYPAHD